MKSRGDWEGIKARLPIGSFVKGVVVNVAAFGVTIDLGDGAVGLLLVPEMAGDDQKQLTDYPRHGEDVSGHVIQHRDSNLQVSLTQKRH